MSAPFIPAVPGFAITPTRIAFGTVLTGIIPPFAGPSPLMYGVVPGSGGRPNWTDNLTTHLTTLLYTTAGTAHTVYVMRPLNWTTLASAVAKNTLIFNVTDDPGAYATTYRYPGPCGPIGLGGTCVPTVADNVIAANDYVAYQLADGRWQLDIVASVSTLALTLTTGTPNVTGATVAAGSPLFFFGIKSDTVPQTGLPHLNFLTVASTNKSDLLANTNGAGIPALNPGDPLIVFSDNPTATGIIELATGDYRKY